MPTRPPISVLILQLVTMWLWAAPGVAQHRLVVEDAEPARAGHWRAAAIDLLAARGVQLDPAPAPATASGGVVPSRLKVLGQVEERLRAARDARAQMEEGVALKHLLRADAALRSDLSLPGISRWLSEVQLHLGIVAAQQGRLELARQAFEVASSLDPGRRLQAAEAPPAVVDLAWSVARELRQMPPSRFVIEARPPAQAFLDDEPLGPTPVQVQTVPGRHLLRLEAPNARPYAALIDALSGERRPVVVQLAPEAAIPPPAPAPGPAESPEVFAERVRAYSEGYPELVLWWLRPTPEGERAGLWRCRGGDCGFASTLEAPRALRGAPPESSQTVAPAETPRWKRAWPWIVVGAAVLAGGLTAALWTTRSESGGQQTVVVDPSATAPFGLPTSFRDR